MGKGAGRSVGCLSLRISGGIVVCYDAAVILLTALSIIMGIILTVVSSVKV